MHVFRACIILILLQENGFLPETVLNFLTRQGSGFKVRETGGLTMEQLIEEVI